jgi:hypothetical protein
VRRRVDRILSLDQSGDATVDVVEGRVLRADSDSGVDVEQAAKSTSTPSAAWRICTMRSERRRCCGGRQPKLIFHTTLMPLGLLMAGYGLVELSIAFSCRVGDDPRPAR